MTNEYADIHARLIEHGFEIARQKKDLRALRDPKFDPLMDVDTEFPRDTMTRETIFEALMQHARQDEAAIQAEFVESCIARLKVAMNLIEAQIALSKRPFCMKKVFTDKASIEKCLVKDHYAVRSFYEQFEKLRGHQQEKHLPMQVDEESMMDELAKITMRYGRLNNGEVTKKLFKVKKEYLINEIFMARMEYAGLVTDDIGFTLAKTSNTKDEALHLMVAADEGLFEKEAGLNKIIANNLTYADRRLKDCQYMIAAVREFLADIYETGYDTYGREAFEVKKYKSVTINGLDQLAP